MRAFQKLLTRIKGTPNKGEHYIDDPSNRKIEREYEHRKVMRRLDNKEEKDPEGPHYEQNLVEPVESIEELFKKKLKK